MNSRFFMTEEEYELVIGQSLKETDKTKYEQPKTQNTMNLHSKES